MKRINDDTILFYSNKELHKTREKKAIKELLLVANHYAMLSFIPFGSYFARNELILKGFWRQKEVLWKIKEKKEYRTWNEM